jgi:hypothetical protein
VTMPPRSPASGTEASSGRAALTQWHRVASNARPGPREPLAGRVSHPGLRGPEEFEARSPPSLGLPGVATERRQYRAPADGASLPLEDDSSWRHRTDRSRRSRCPGMTGTGASASWSRSVHAPDHQRRGLSRAAGDGRRQRLFEHGARSSRSIPTRARRRRRHSIHRSASSVARPTSGT